MLKSLENKEKNNGFLMCAEEKCAIEIPALNIVEFAGRWDTEPGNIKAVTCESFENMLSNMVGDIESVRGFILPIPRLSGLLWKEDFEKVLGDIGEIYDIFDEYVPQSPVRSCYFEMLEDYIVKKYMYPVESYAREIGKSISFYMASGVIQYDFMPVINPMRLAYEGFSLTFEKSSPELDAIGRLPDSRGKNVLLIKPVRGCRRKYVYTGEKRRVRMETPALCTSFEGTFYCERLTQHGINFTAVDEYWFENSACAQEGKINLNSAEYEEIILCNGCFFSEKGKNILAEAKRCGVLINSEKLLQELMEEIQWEK